MKPTFEELPRVFVNFNHSHPSVIFVGKSSRLSFEWSPEIGFTRVGSSLAFKYLVVTHIDNYISLIVHVINFYIILPY